MVDTIAIVAIPSDSERVHKISTEKKAHMTLLFLGEMVDETSVQELANYTKHVAETFKPELYVEVDKRGVLGDEEADVLFFKKNSWSFKSALDLRHNLLQSSLIKRLYDSTEQYPEWTPHLTLGYPKNPAGEIDPPIHFVSFDRLALWVGDSMGPEFKFSEGGGMVEDTPLYYSDNDDTIEAFLTHYGVPGMRWGVRNSRSGGSSSKEGLVTRLKKKAQGPDGPEEVIVTTRPGAKVKTAGGRKQPASEDAINAAKTRQVARKSSTDALSNQELQSLVTRMNLEQQYGQLSQKNKTAGQKFIDGLIGEGQKVADQEMKKKARQVALKFAAAAVT